MIFVLFTALLVVVTIGMAYLTTRMSLFGLPLANSWSDLSGAFTAAAALFTGLALVGVVVTLMVQAKNSKEQGAGLQSSLETQSEAARYLKNSADNLEKHTASLERRATLAEQQTKLQIEERRLDRALSLMDKFFASPKPNSNDIKGLAPTVELSQAQAKEFAPGEWLSSLAVLLSALARLKDDEELSPQLAKEADDIVEEVRFRLSAQERSLLYLAMFPNPDFPAFKPSRLAQHLQHFQIFPFIEDRQAPAVQGRERARRKILPLKS